MNATGRPLGRLLAGGTCVLATAANALAVLPQPDLPPAPPVSAPSVASPIFWVAVGGFAAGVAAALAFLLANRRYRVTRP